MSEQQNRTKMLTIKIKDCTVQTFRAGGKGGQNQNKTDSGVRIIHPPSGARGESREKRGQLENKKLAFRRMAETKEFVSWVNLMHARISGDIDAAVKDGMRPENLDIQYYTPE